MAQYTRHPVAAPPQAPARESNRRLLMRGHAILAACAMFAAPALPLAFGEIVAGVALALVSLGSLGWWIPRIVSQQRTTPFPWRRLPWAALGYLTLALASVAWSVWPGATLLTWAGMAMVTVNGLFIATMLSWQEVVRVLATALKWIIALSVVFELWVSVVIRKPVFPFGFTPPAGKVDPQLYWSRDNLFDGGRIQGIVGNANLLGMLCVIAILVFAVRYAAGAPRRGWLLAWTAAAVFLLLRAGSATTWLCLAVAAAVLAAILVMRRTRRPGQRTAAYAAFAAVGVAGIVTAVLMREQLFALFGRSGSLTGRTGIWAAVGERFAQRPAFGWGFSSPWVPWDANFDGWIIDHGQTVMQAHNLWIDVSFQLGVFGLLVLVVVFAALTWRSWFFAVDRPRWDLDANRTYSPISVLPSLITAVLLVQSLTESNPGMLWGWMLVILFSFKIKTAPIVGIGRSERGIERGTETNGR